MASGFRCGVPCTIDPSPKPLAAKGGYERNLGTRLTFPGFSASNEPVGFGAKFLTRGGFSWGGGGGRAKMKVS